MAFVIVMFQCYDFFSEHARKLEESGAFFRPTRFLDVEGNRKFKQVVTASLTFETLLRPFYLEYAFLLIGRRARSSANGRTCLILRMTLV